MTKAILKTQKSDAGVEAFLGAVPDEQQRRDAFALLALFRKVTRAEPKMWGSSIVGFGDRHLRYESGRELDWFTLGFSPRKQTLTLYLPTGFEGQAELMRALGKHKTGKGCLYIKRLDDVDARALEKLLRQSVKHAAAADRQPPR